MRTHLTVILLLFRRIQRIVVVLTLAASCTGPASAFAAGISRLLPAFELRCDGKLAPLAVADARPVFSWRLQATSSALHSVGQTAYELQVSKTDPDFFVKGSILWDSGKVRSSAISGVIYAGPSLEAWHHYAWRVRVWDERGNPSSWSSIAHWDQAPAWHAQWIEAPNADAKEQPMPLFRKCFRLARPAVRAILYASGLGQDELRLNGRKVSRDVLTPGWSDYRKTTYYDSYDVTRLLHPGQNAIGIVLGNGMYRVLHTRGRYTKFVGSFGSPKCIAQLDIDFSGGSSIEVDSDGSWKTHPGPITFSSTYGGEDFDARLDPQGWDKPEFNDADWSSAIVTGGPGGTLTPELAPAIRVMHTYTPVRVTHPKQGIIVYDFGQNFAGWPSIAVRGNAGATVKLIPGELLDQSGLVSQRSSGRPQWFSYTLRGQGIEKWHPRFSYYGFRYLQVEGASAPTGVRIINVLGEAVHTSSPEIGSFESSNTLLNRIHTLILLAIENNAMSIFTDCPHREKLGWLEETHLMAPSMLYDFDFSGLYKATVRNIADAQKGTGDNAGMVPEIAPQYVVFDPQKYDVFNDSPEWGSAAVLAPWYVYQCTGDLRFLAAQYNVMKRYVAYLATRARDGIIDYGLGDWYDIGPGNPGISKLTSPGVTATAIYFQDIQVMEMTAALLRHADESDHYKRQADLVRRAFNARFFDAVQHRYDKGSQTAQAMPLVVGLVPEDERIAVLNTLVSDIRAHQNHVTAGDVGFHYVVDALLEGGRSDVLLDMLERTDAPSYGYQLAQGATSLTEAWDANPSSSQDHFMLGDAEEWFYRGLGGISVNLARLGAQRIVLVPAVLNGVTWVHTSYHSVLGPIQSDWQRGAKQTIYKFAIPANATATIELNTASPQAVTANGMSLHKASGILAARIDSEHVLITATSGQYTIRAANPVTAHP